MREPLDRCEVCGHVTYRGRHVDKCPTCPVLGLEP